MARAKARTAREPLSRERIEEAALALIEREGLEAYSARKLAADLGCEAMSIYHWFPSKQHLMDALVDRMLGEIEEPTAGLSAMDELRQRAVAFRAVGLRYPNFLRYLSFHRLNTPGGIRYIGTVLNLIMRLGVDVETSARLFRVTGYYLTGAVLDETSGYAKGHSAAEPVSDEQIVRDYPAVVAVNPYFKRDQHEKTFLLGLDLIFDGFRRLLPGADAFPVALSLPPMRPARPSRGSSR